MEDEAKDAAAVSALLIEHLPTNEVEPLELIYSPVCGFSSETPTAFRSVLRINDPISGTLMPSDYRITSEKSERGERLSMFALEKVIGTVKFLMSKAYRFDWVSFYVPVKTLISSELPGQLKSKFEEENFSKASKVCIEVDSSVLYENREVALQCINAVHKLGCQLMISGYGNEFCPVTRLRGFPFGIVMIDPCLFSEEVNDNDSATRAVVMISKGLGRVTVAGGVTSDDSRDRAEKYGCDSLCDSKLLSLAELISLAGGDAE